ncbi:BREX-6 system BrxE protein [Desulfosediminicola sp.]|uniref:BREX-6 system BrxE protein n=1 Tax=Desulfosediminicola sp. TaxID=2886825 RepID=UPI003AF27BCE
MSSSDIDIILHAQLIIARMGEKELMNWWNTDIAYEMGGADFLQRLLGDTIAPLSAGEAILRAAYLKESQLVSEMPNSQNVYTLFRPEPEMGVALEERLRHFKRYPEDVPKEISQILDPKKDWTPDDLVDLIKPEKPVTSTGSSFGREIEKTVGLGMVDVMTNMASILKTNEKGRYVLTFYREA